jgi:hypothetical protein
MMEEKEKDDIIKLLPKKYKNKVRVTPKGWSPQKKAYLVKERGSIFAHMHDRCRGDHTKCRTNCHDGDKVFGKHGCEEFVR